MQRFVRALVTAGLALALGPRAARAQFADRASQDWRALDTPHFRFIFPRPLEPWALPVTERFESVRATVDALVGSTPEARVTVVMDDPITISNGLTLAELHEPTILLLATPPAPRTDISDHPGWGEILSVHEYAHAAHLTRPSRNPFFRALERLPFLPIDVGPIAQRAPRWVTEGYATYVEGRVLGSGRPHGVWRAAVLRQWALEGKLPSYAAMSGVSGYRGGSFAYLAGSAYLEWLVARSGATGDSALPHVWRRLSARQSRSFGSAFAGVFGGAPGDLYDRFTVDVTTRAVEARRALEGAGAGLAQGDTVQSLEWETGDPALSPDGAHLAIVLRSRDLPSRVVVWSTKPEPPDTAAAGREARLRARDPEDVPGVEWRPRPKKALATLWAEAGGRSYDEPRFLPGGERILLTRFEPLPDGSRRPDLFLWNWKRGDVRRVTRGAAIVAADPAPDGATAVGVRCIWGVCDLVRISLGDGALTVLRAGSPSVVWARPRVSRDGRSIAAGVQRAGRWHAVLMDAKGGAERVLGADDGAQRYDPAFLPDGTGLVLTSEAGGIPNLEVVAAAEGAGRPITRVTGAAMAPEPAPDGGVYFLRLHARGLDLARVRSDARIGPVVALDSALTPVAPLPLAASLPLPAASVPEPRAYGLGHREHRLIPSIGISGGALAGRLALAGSDPVGRLGWLAQGAFGRTVWRGASLRWAYRGAPALLQAEAFATTYHPRTVTALAQPNGLPGDVALSGGSASLELRHTAGSGESWLRGGAALGSVRLDSARVSRPLAFGELGRSDVWALGVARVGARASASGAAGSTGGDAWRRFLAQAAVWARSSPGAPALELRALRGASAGGGRFEALAVGGEEPPLFEPLVMSQQVAMPALPPASLVGSELTVLQARTDLLGLTVYGWAARAGHGAAGWQRVVGLEQEADTDPIPLARVPGMHLVVGIGYTLDELPQRAVRFYGMTSLRP